MRLISLVHLRETDTNAYELRLELKENYVIVNCDSNSLKHCTKFFFILFWCPIIFTLGFISHIYMGLCSHWIFFLVVLPLFQSLMFHRLIAYSLFQGFLLHNISLHRVSFHTGFCFSCPSLVIEPYVLQSYCSSLVSGLFVSKYQYIWGWVLHWVLF